VVRSWVGEPFPGRKSSSVLSGFCQGADIISVQREEEGTQGGALRDTSSERARFRHTSFPSYPVSAVYHKLRLSFHISPAQT